MSKSYTVKVTVLGNVDLIVIADLPNVNTKHTDVNLKRINTNGII